ncbi:MAG TPA: ATP-binding protein [Chitinophagaceae bacterium]|nr:ATP-binding protein [Chitinophagaceae bacterium]
MKNSTWLIVLLFIVLASNSQIKAVDSLKLLLPKEKTDTGRIQKLIYIGNAYWEKRNDSALIYFRDALSRSEQMGYIRGEIRARSSIAEYLYNFKTDHAKALELFLYNLKVEEQTGDTLFIFWDTRHVGIIYERIEDYGKQFEYVNRLRNLVNSGLFKDSAKRSLYGVIVDNRLGTVYEKKNNLDSAKYFRLRVFQYGIANKDLLRTATGSIGLGEVYKKEKKYDSALHYFRIALATAIIRNKDVYRHGLISIASLHWEMKQTDSAFHYAEKAYALSQIANIHLQMIGAAELLAEIYHTKKQPDSAYKYLSRSTALKDSIFTSEKLVKVQNLSLQESLQKLQQEQTKREAVAEYKSKVKIYSLVAGVAALLILILILYRNNRQRQVANKKVEKAYVDLKSTQSQLIQSEKMASLGELTAGIAHEIQNPLNFVNNFSDVNKELLTEMNFEIEQENYGEVKSIARDITDNEEKINHHGKRADAIVKGMLQHSRSSNGIKEPTDINALADEYLRLSYHGLRARDKSFNATMKTDFDQGIGKINIVAQDVGRVILNLINNAFYAVDEKKKGPQATKGGAEYEPTVSVSTKETNGKIKIKVKDNGNGISQKVLEKIFQPFFTTKPTGQGTGLGLSLSYDIVKAHGGELKVETREREGSEFIIVLPKN